VSRQVGSYLLALPRVPTGFAAGARQPATWRGNTLAAGNTIKEIGMPIILWLLGVPLTIVLLLMLFGVL